MSDDFSVISRDLKLPLESVTAAVRLLDEGNAIPFIARFRKDLTGGLDADQLLAIKQRAGELRALAERKAFVLKSIESQGKLTEVLADEIGKATNSRRVEDLYLPFKAKKQSLALTARQQGLEPLANEIFRGERPDVDLPSRATEFVRVDRGLTCVDDVISGVRHLIAERLSERSELRRELRKVIWSTGELICKLLSSQEEAAETESSNDSESSRGTETAPESAAEPSGASLALAKAAGGHDGDGSGVVAGASAVPKTTDPPIADSPSSSETSPAAAGGESTRNEQDAESASAQSARVQNLASTAPSSALTVDEPATKVVADTTAGVESGATSSAGTTSAEATSTEATSTEATPAGANSAEGNPADGTSVESVSAKPNATEPNATEPNAAESNPAESTDSSGPTESKGPSGDSAAAAAPPAANRKRKKKKKKKKSAPNPFADYADFAESIRKIPHHRVLAINRGERGGQLKVKLKVDGDKLETAAISVLVPADHPFQPFIEDCARDALNRLVIPSLEREVRRELTDAAERHAVQVFAHNLKGLLLHTPIRGRKILAIDPGYKNGCTLAVLDPHGTVLHTDRVSIVGNEQRREENRKKLAELARQHAVDLIAIGNGTACREAEKLVSDALAQELNDLPIKYVIVNEAGASIYSTSEIGKEELPDLPPNARSAVSIGRRLLDPLSELVKISPGHLGVGLYQHDIKAKHLAESLDEVVESCVNFVGVNTATASPALLGYVAGLNQLTARRLIEHRQTKSITNRQDLKEVAGIGEATFVQSAGFLRVYGGDNPFDETAIHPESYPVAEQVLQRIGVDAATWQAARRSNATAPSASPTEGEPGSRSGEILEKLNAIDAGALAKELQVGELLMQDIIESLKRPTHDPRLDGGGPVFRSGIIKIEDLKPEMELQSQVVNVVDFGVFVDVGLGYSCLVHVSELSAGYINDLYHLYAVGDSLTTWVKDVDVARRRVKLTAVKPGTPRADKRRRERGDRPAKPAGGESRTPRPSRDGEAGRGRNQQRGPGQRSGQRSERGEVGRSRGKPGGFKSGKRRTERPSKPKPVAPITKEMLAGEKPMRSFSDLAQFYTKKKDDPSDS